MTSQYKSLLGLTEVIADSADISNIDLSATNITGLTTTNVGEGVNLYFTNARVNINPNVSSNTTHRDRTDNPHAVTATQVGIDDTDDISEGVTNLYYTDIRFDGRLATKTTSSLAEGSNLYYTTTRANADFDNQLATKTTTNLAEGSNLYYTDVRFDNRFGIKTTTNLTEGSNLYYTDVRFDTRLATKTTTNLTEGTNLYYTDARFDARFGIKTTDNLTEGTNLYYTTARANADFDSRLATKTTTDLAEGTNLYYTDARFDTRLATKTTTDLAEGTNLYYTDARFDTRLATKTTTDLAEGTNLYYTDARFDTRLATKTTTNLAEGTNLYYTDARFDTRLATKTTDNLTEGTNLYYTEARVSANTDVKSNSDYRGVGHLPLAGGIMTGDIEYVSSSTFEVPLLSSNTSASPDFIASESSYLVSATLQAWKLFDASLATTWHIDLPYDYVTNTTYNGTYQTALDGGIKKGQWIQIQTASETILTQFIITPYVGWLNRSPIDFVVGISTDGTNFTTIFTKTAESWTVDGEPKTYTGITPTAGTYFRVIPTKTGSAGCGYAKLEMTFANKTTLLKADGGVVMTGDLNMGAFNITNVDAVDGVDVEGLNTTVNNHISNTNNPHGVLATQITDFDTEVSANTDVKANTAKISYPTADSTKVGFISVTQAVDLDTMESDIKTNSDYVAVGHLPLAGGTLSGNLDMGNYDIDNVNQVFIDRKSVANNKLVLWDNGTPSTTAFYGFGIQSATLLYNVPAIGANHKFYYAGTNEVFRIGDAGVYSYRDLDITGNLSISGEMNIGGAKIARGATNGLQLYGASGNIAGPHIQAFVSTDDYPVYQQLNLIHNAVFMCYDGYYDGSTWRSSSTLSNLIIYKASTNLYFQYDSGISLGGAITWNIGFSMDTTNGLVSCKKGLDVTGNITVSGTVDGVDIQTLNTTANNAIPLAAHNTYVPTIGDGTNNFTLTSATGHYTVIGNMCHVSFYVLWTSKGSASGTIRLSLPFTSATGPYSSMVLSAHNGIDSSLPSIGCFNLSATNYVVFFDKPTGLFAMNQTSFTNAGAICGSGFFYL